MNLETFFSNFELFADAPNGVQKLRELILQLAVQGKLVPQNPEDEPAAVLLEKIKEEKERLVKEGKIKKSKKLPDVDVGEMAFDLPDGWEWVRFDSICNQITDGAHHTPIYTITGIPFLSVKDISGGTINLSNTRYISEETHEKLIKRCKPEFNDVLLTKVGTTGIGKVIDVDVEFSIFVSLALLKFNQNLLSPYYLELVINSPLVKDQSEKNTQGIGNKNLVLKHIKNFTFPLPPLNEQHRIVAKVDALMKLCDELETRQQNKRDRILKLGEVATTKLLTPTTKESFNQHWKTISDNFDLLYSTPENVKQLRQAILQLAVMGKLVPQNPNDEPAAVLLEKIKEEKERLIKEGKIKKSKELPDVDKSIISSKLPRGWTVEYLGNLINEFQNGISKRKASEGESIPVLRLADIVSGEHLSEKLLREIQLSLSEIEKYKVIKGDVLVIRVNGSADLVGQFIPCLVHKKWAYCDHLIRVRLPLSLLDINYLCIFTKTKDARKHLIGKTVTTAGQRTINQTGLASLLIPLPPLNEQHRIVTKVNQLMSLCDELEAKLTQSINDREKLMSAAVRQVLAA
jgi:type I restriction enzyme S subunit